MAKSVTIKTKPDKIACQPDLSAELEQVKAALKVSEENYAALIDHSADGIVILFSHTINFVNRKIMQITGYSREELIGKAFINLVAPEFNCVLKESYEMKLVEGEPNALEMEFITKDGRHIPVETRAQTIVFEGREASMVAVRDVTERKKAEDELKLSEKNFRTSLDSSEIGIRISDNKDHTSYVNQALLDIFGYKNIEEVRKSPPPEHYAPAAHASWADRHEKLLRG